MLKARLGLALATLALAGPAAAEMLYKCVDANGLATIQQAKCPKGSTQAWARDTAPEPPPTPEQLAAAQARAQAEQQERERREAEAQEFARQEAEAAAQAEADAAAQAEAEADAKAHADDKADAKPPPANAANDQCDRAKAFAAQVRAMPWLELQPDQVQKVYGWVTQQCADAH
jgi:colicin import membrane protein